MINISATEVFVKQTVGTEDLPPRTNVEESLVSWTVEASLEEFGILTANAGVDHVVHFGLREGDLVDRNANVTEYYVVFTADGKDSEKCAETEKFLKYLVKTDPFPILAVWKDVLDY